ncbi:MAG: hypothetical protein FJ271_23025 [Planctomycetes bacterium]|nr:hypothetical protein [Planctomycetota bacterium]
MTPIQFNHANPSVECDLARIRQSWQELKKASPKADAFSFLARIAATGKVRTKHDARQRPCRTLPN